MESPPGSSDSNPQNPSENSSQSNDNTSSGGENRQKAAEPEREIREYGCRYCEKMFTNKQALGGHQNAHKFQRSMEKSARDANEGRFDYPGMSSAILNPCYRSNDFVNRSVSSWTYPSFAGYNNSRAEEPYGTPPHYLPGFNNGYSGWSRVNEFPGENVPNQGRLLNLGGGGSSSRVPVPGSRIRPNNPGNEEDDNNVPGNEDNINLRNVPENEEEDDDSELDLTLRL